MKINMHKINEDYLVRIQNMNVDSEVTVDLD